MILIGLYTSRIILNVLGVEDYSTYNVVGGVVSMFLLISVSMTSAISRFLTFELGCGDMIHFKMVFLTSLNVQFIMAIIVVVTAEIIGVWFLNTQMKVPEGRLETANWVMQCFIMPFLPRIPVCLLGMIIACNVIQYTKKHVMLVLFVLV